MMIYFDSTCTTKPTVYINGGIVAVCDAVIGLSLLYTSKVLNWSEGEGVTVARLRW